MPLTYAIIVAAGKGLRMRTRIPKQYLPLQGMPVMAHTIGSFCTCSDTDEILVVIPPGDQDHCRQTILPCVQTEKPIRLVSGGAERQDSVFNALKLIQDPEALVAIHDGVRPMIEPAQISACIQAARSTGACIMALPVTDTVKRANTDRRITATVERSDLWLAQTPQVFCHEIIMTAHQQARQDRFVGSDDALLVERLGREVTLIEGHKHNLKITTREDILLAEYLLGKANAAETNGTAE